MLRIKRDGGIRSVCKRWWRGWGRQGSRTGGVHLDIYLTEHRYPSGCVDLQKRSIRKKAGKFVVRDGELFFKKKRKGKV